MNKEQMPMPQEKEEVSLSSAERWPPHNLEARANQTALREYLSELETDMRTRMKELKEEINEKKSLLHGPETLPYMREKYFAEIRKYETFISDLERDIEELHAPRNIHEMSTDVGDFRIVYERHGQENSEGVLKDLDAYAKEFVGSPRHVSEGLVNSGMSGEPFDSVNGYANIPVAAAIRASNMPLYYCDVFPGENFKERMHEDFDLKKNMQFFKSIEFLLGAGGLLSTAGKIKIDKKNKEKGTYTRRDFLKTVGLGVASFGFLGTGVYRTSFPGKGVMYEEGSFLRALDKKRDELLSTTGLFAVLMILRNAVMAQKLYTTARKMKDRGESARGDKPFVGIEVGYDHSGIEPMLSLSEGERLAVIGDIASSIGEVFEDPQKELAAILRATYDAHTETWYIQPSFDEGIVQTLQKEGIIKNNTT